ncbi:MAG: peptidoglycan LD-endopeptidase CwlK [Acidimicrobiaceae bacterium]|nr:peptidoglycan LD-endopeptidase CwlK [Acidimicrobiaceae bacterium]
MKEAARLERNTERLTECFSPFAGVLRTVLDEMESQGFRPRIQHAWRSEAEQLDLFKAGKTHVKFGFHNTVNAGGGKESLACDVLDDDQPLNSRTNYLLALSIAARAHGLETGIVWDLKAADAAPVEAALAAHNLGAPVRLGFDPTHVEVKGVSIAAARNGTRPTMAGVGAGPAPVASPPPVPAGAPPASGHVHVVTSGDTLGRIAKDNGITLARLLELNPEFKANPNLIKPGQQVHLP